jgi:cyanophycin synthetase
LDLVGSVVKYLYPEGSDPYIPIITVAGSHGKTLVTSMVDYMFRLEGRHTGHACSTGVYLNGTKTREGIADNKAGHMIPLVDGNVETAILEIDSLTASAEGLAFKSAYTSAVLNCYESQEALPNLYERVMAARKLLVRHTSPKGFVILNVAIPEFSQLAREAQGEIVIISSDPDHPNAKAPSSERGVIATTMGRMLVLKDGGKIIPLVNYLDAPLTFDGLADFNIENLLAAAAIAYVNDVSVNIIRNGLLTFTNNPHQLPGAMNQFQVQGRYIFVDLATKVANLGIASRFVKRYSRRFSLGDVYAVLSFPDEVDVAVSRRVLLSIRPLFKRALMYELYNPDTIEQNDEVFELTSSLESGVRKMWSMLRENDVLLLTSRDAHEVLKIVSDLKERSEGSVR